MLSFPNSSGTENQACNQPSPPHFTSFPPPEPIVQRLGSLGNRRPANRSIFAARFPKARPVANHKQRRTYGPKGVCRRLARYYRFSRLRRELFVVDNLLKTPILPAASPPRPTPNAVDKIGNIGRGRPTSLLDGPVFDVNKCWHRLYVFRQTRPRRSFFYARLLVGNGPTLRPVGHYKLPNHIAGG